MSEALATCSSRFGNATIFSCRSLHRLRGLKYEIIAAHDNLLSRSLHRLRGLKSDNRVIADGAHDVAACIGCGD